MTLALHAQQYQHLPVFPGTEGMRWWQYIKLINWSYWLKRAPMLLLAVPSAYGVGAFASEHLPWQVAVVAGFAFEGAYLGAISFADGQHDESDAASTRLWWALNLAAVLCSVLSNLLFFAGGSYAAITPEVATHAIPFPVVGFIYGLAVHRHSTKAAARAAAIIQAQEIVAQARAAQEQAEAEDRALRDKHRCAYCGAGFRSDASRRGHLAKCPQRPRA